MKKLTIMMIGLLVLLAAAILVGCGESGTDADMDGAATTAITADSTTVASGEDTASGIDIPDAIPGGYVDLTPEQAKALIETMPETIVVDVSPIYDQGHLPGAVNYYGGDGTLAAAIPSLDPTATYLVYCHSESASRAGAQALIDAGFSAVYRLQGEYDAWVAAGYPVEM